MPQDVDSDFSTCITSDKLRNVLSTETFLILELNFTETLNITAIGSRKLEASSQVLLKGGQLHHLSTCF